MAISAAMVKMLREKTGAGMLDCKIALEETKGDTEEAEKILRKKGLAAAAKKAGRVAAEGLIGHRVEGGTAVLVEVPVPNSSDVPVTTTVRDAPTSAAVTV